MQNYNIKGTGLDITDELRAYVEKGLSHSEKFFTRGPVQIDVELENTPAREGDRNRAEFNVTMGGDLHRIERWGETMHSAIDLAAGELALELGRHKKKKQSVVRRSAARVKDYLRGWNS